MPQTVKVTVTLTINPPAATALVATPETVTLPDEVSGVSVSAVPVAVVSGGTPPYQQPVVDPSSPSQLPAGMTASIDGQGNVTWSGTPPLVSAPVTGTFILDVSDSGA